jgi:hypothetical protein
VPACRCPIWRRSRLSCSETRGISKLAAVLKRTPRLVRRWVAGERPISAAASDLITELVRDRHSSQMRRTRSTYLNMVDALTPSSFRARLLAMDLDELRLDDQLRRAAAEPVAAEPALPESALHHFPEPTYRDAAE